MFGTTSTKLRSLTTNIQKAIWLNGRKVDLSIYQGQTAKAIIFSIELNIATTPNGYRTQKYSRTKEDIIPELSAGVVCIGFGTVVFLPKEVPDSFA